MTQQGSQLIFNSSHIKELQSYWSAFGLQNKNALLILINNKYTTLHMSTLTEKECEDLAHKVKLENQFEIIKFKCMWRCLDSKCCCIN